MNITKNTDYMFKYLKIEMVLKIMKYELLAYYVLGSRCSDIIFNAKTIGLFFLINLIILFL